MPEKWTVSFSYVVGAVRFKDLVYLSLVSDELAERGLDHAYFSQVDAGDWCGDGERRKWSCVDICIVKVPIEQAVHLGSWGEVHCQGSQDEHEEKIGSGGNVPSKRGPLRAASAISGRAYAVGMGRQVYRRDGRDQWTAIDEQIRPAKGDTKPYGFDTIAGFSETDIYAAGRYGEVFHYNGKTWTKLPVPTDQIITHACCAGDGNVYLCGRNGLLLKGRNEEWKVIAHGKRDDLWNLAWFNDRLYVVTMKAVFWLSEEADGDYLNDVEWTNGDKPKTCLRLSAADGVLWSIGAKDVLSFDGTTWTRIDGKVAE